MSDLTSRERIKLEKIFDMNGGYVLDFSNRTFEDFFIEHFDIEIYSEKYSTDGESKAKRLRTFWKIESNYVVGMLLLALLKEVQDTTYTDLLNDKRDLFDECVKIATKLKENAVVEDIAVIRDVKDDKDFTLLAKSIRDSIEKNQPEAALDRLHTYVMKFIRQLCKKNKLEIKRNESLNALFGKYVKFITANKKIESPMAERILRYSIHVLEAFNDIRNNKSFAHDNKILNYPESLLIFNNITNIIRFIESLEKENKEAENDKSEWDDLPF